MNNIIDNILQARIEEISRYLASNATFRESEREVNKLYKYAESKMKDGDYLKDMIIENMDDNSVFHTITNGIYYRMGFNDAISLIMDSIKEINLDKEYSMMLKN